MRAGIRRYKDISTALASIVRPEAEYTIMRHVLAAGEVVRRHHHEHAREWILLRRGYGELSLDDKRNEMRSRRGEVVVASINPGIVHGFVSRTKTEYYVVRDMPAEAIYL